MFEIPTLPKICVFGEIVYAKISILSASVICDCLSNTRPEIHSRFGMKWFIDIRSGGKKKDILKICGRDNN